MTSRACQTCVTPATGMPQRPSDNQAKLSDAARRRSCGEDTSVPRRLRAILARWFFSVIFAEFRHRIGRNTGHGNC
jgi:hypothetical protein